MTEVSTLQIVALLGWLILASSAFAAYRLSWKRTLAIGLTWLAVFGLAYLGFLFGMGR